MKKSIIFGTSSGCGPCAGFKMTLDLIDDDLIKEMKIIDIKKNPQDAINWNIDCTPVLIVLSEDGRAIKKLQGNVSLDKVIEFLRD